jgi:hypothetical protein
MRQAERSERADRFGAPSLDGCTSWQFRGRSFERFR